MEAAVLETYGAQLVLRELADPVPAEDEIVVRVKAYTDAFTKRWNEPPDNMGTAASARTGQWDFFDVIGSCGGEEVLPPLATLGC